MLQTIKTLLLKIINDIDTDNTNISEEDEVQIIRCLRKYTRKDNEWSKYQAYTFLNISRSKFDKMVRDGEIPRGHKIAGYKELRWYEKDIRKLVKIKTLP